VKVLLWKGRGIHMGKAAELIYRQMVDVDTGEIEDVFDGRQAVSNNTEQEMKVMLTLKPNESIKPPRHNNRKPAKGNEEFTMVYKEQVAKYVLDSEKPLTDNEKAFLFTMLPFLGYKGVINAPDKNGVYMDLNVTRAGEMMGWKHPDTINKVLKGLQGRGIIKLVGKRPKYIVLNPLLFYRGSASKRNTAYKDYESLNVRATGEGEHKIIDIKTEYLH
jgi:hypothetical protein